MYLKIILYYFWNYSCILETKKPENKDNGKSKHTQIKMKKNLKIDKTKGNKEKEREKGNNGKGEKWKQEKGARHL